MTLRNAKSRAAAMKDRHLSRNGADQSMKRNGAGAYNWGSFKEEIVDHDREYTEEEGELFSRPSGGTYNAGPPPAPSKVVTIDNKTFDNLKATGASI
ncbi:hypothetical protein EV182_008123 [Spiromyces aspiralis]|uniref:Uncharacterized protein n=1 Tax=Spiromyces aspiralis TaxID=68401 RepID=A0ACC1HJF1_9FUNG|nr:hypothetical protein EV182_008123 [Spiromyces aspiralis]